MKKKLAIGLLAGAAIATAAILLAQKRRKKHISMLREVSDEGYETAHDILYPGKGKRASNLRFGPVLPL